MHFRDPDEFVRAGKEKEIPLPMAPKKTAKHKPAAKQKKALKKKAAPKGKMQPKVKTMKKHEIKSKPLPQQKPVVKVAPEVKTAETKSEKYMVLGFSLQKIRNFYEIEVVKQMNEVIDEFPNFDKCQLCIEDVYALSLKNIPPKYVQQGGMVLIREVSNSEIRRLIRNAIKIVTENPNH